MELIYLPPSIIKLPITKYYMLDAIADYLRENPSVYKLGTIEFSTFDFSNQDYVDLTDYSIEDLREIAVTYPNPNWPLVFLLKGSNLAEELGDQNGGEIRFKRRPMITVKSLLGNDTVCDLDIEPGHQRIVWAAKWGFSKSEFIICDLLGRFDLPLITDPLVFLSVDDATKIKIRQHEFQDKKYFQICNTDAFDYSKSAIPRLCQAWTKEKTCFELETNIKLSHQDICMIRILANSDHSQVFGNGWTIHNHGVNLGTTKRYNFPLNGCGGWNRTTTSSL